jgi:homoserine kinase type II
MASYTEINLDQAREILSLYGIKNVTEIAPMAFGISNSNYHITLENKDSLVLKISNDKNKEELAEEQRILQYLKQNNYAYSVAPFLTLDGQTIYTWKKYYGVIYPFAHGSVPEIGHATVNQIGMALGKLHLSSYQKHDLDTFRAHTSVGFGLQQILDFFDSEVCPEDFKSTFKEIFNENDVKKMLNSSLPSGIIHGDLYYDNTLFDGDNIRHVLDFEQAGIGEFLFDLGISISGSCLENGKLSNELMNSLLDGYEKIRPLESDEQDLLHEAIILGLFSISRWRISRFIENGLDDTKKDNYKELLLRAVDFHKANQ